MVFSLKLLQEEYIARATISLDGALINMFSNDCNFLTSLPLLLRNYLLCLGTGRETGHYNLHLGVASAEAMSFGSLAHITGLDASDEEDSSVHMGAGAMVARGGASKK